MRVQFLTRTYRSTSLPLLPFTSTMLSPNRGGEQQQRQTKDDEQTIRKRTQLNVIRHVFARALYTRNASTCFPYNKTIEYN